MIIVVVVVIIFRILVLDTVMTCVMLFFLAEQVLQSVANSSTYLWSFFFFADLIGVCIYMYIYIYTHIHT